MGKCGLLVAAGLFVRFRIVRPGDVFEHPRLPDAMSRSVFEVPTPIVYTSTRVDLHFGADSREALGGFQ